MNLKGRELEADSNTGRARAFFDANPTATLTPHELAKTLDLTKLQAYAVLRNLKRQGFCEASYVIRRKREAA